jgi:hypothetical protein
MDDMELAAIEKERFNAPTPPTFASDWEGVYPNTYPRKQLPLARHEAVVVWSVFAVGSGLFSLALWAVSQLWR